MAALPNGLGGSRLQLTVGLMTRRLRLNNIIIQYWWKGSKPYR